MSALEYTDQRNDLSFEEFEAEISRLSEDTDAILDSIRQVAEPTPRERPKYRSLDEMIQAKRRATGYRDSDDDMTDDGSVPEEVKQALQDELLVADREFLADTDRVSAETRNPAKVASFDGVQSAPKKMMVKGTRKYLFVLVAVLWVYVLLVLYSAFKHGLLNESGFIVWPSVLNNPK